ncbi:MAG: hypothetical protein HZC38_09175 [Chloroflexi bacterium]|nr:hypothetical protein [Chloroflexota bacterium]
MSSIFPSGTITFLFTDIESSTQLWEKHPEAMKSALAKHDSLLRKIFESNSGHVFKTVGDAFCVAFDSPSDANSRRVGIALIKKQRPCLGDP